MQRMIQSGGGNSEDGTKEIIAGSTGTALFTI